MDRPSNQGQDERQVRYKLSEYYRWFWVGMVFGLVILATMMESCFGY